MNFITDSSPYPMIIPWKFPWLSHDCIWLSHVFIPFPNLSPFRTGPSPACSSARCCSRFRASLRKVSWPLQRRCSSCFTCSWRRKMLKICRWFTDLLMMFKGKILLKKHNFKLYHVISWCYIMLYHFFIHVILVNQLITTFLIHISWVDLLGLTTQWDPPTLGPAGPILSLVFGSKNMGWFPMLYWH